MSLDSGGTWFELGSNLPDVPVHDLVVHPREADVIIGTHGRGIWILDATALEEMNADVARAAVHVFAPRDAVRTGSTPNRGYVGARGWSASNPSSTPTFYYYLASDLAGGGDELEFEVLDASGESVWTWSAEGDKAVSGLHQVQLGARAATGRGGRGQNALQRAARQFGGRGRGGTRTGPGHYGLVVRRNDEVIARHAFQIRSASSLPDAGAAGHGYR